MQEYTISVLNVHYVFSKKRIQITIYNNNKEVRNNLKYHHLVRYFKIFSALDLQNKSQSSLSFSADSTIQESMHDYLYRNYRFELVKISYFSDESEVDHFLPTALLLDLIFFHLQQLQCVYGDADQRYGIITLGLTYRQILI